MRPTVRLTWRNVQAAPWAEKGRCVFVTGTGLSPEGGGARPRWTAAATAPRGTGRPGRLDHRTIAPISGTAAARLLAAGAAACSLGTHRGRTEEEAGRAAGGGGAASLDVGHVGPVRDARLGIAEAMIMQGRGRIAGRRSSAPIRRTPT